jgi:hypothetical protein
MSNTLEGFAMSELAGSAAMSPSASSVFVPLEELIDELTGRGGKFYGRPLIDPAIKQALTSGEVLMRGRPMGQLFGPPKQIRSWPGMIAYRRIDYLGPWIISVPCGRGSEVFEEIEVEPKSFEAALLPIAQAIGLAHPVNEEKPRRKPGEKGKVEAKKLLHLEWQARRARGETPRPHAEARALLDWLEHHHPEIKGAKRPKLKTVVEWIRKEFS